MRLFTQGCVGSTASTTSSTSGKPKDYQKEYLLSDKERDNDLVGGEFVKYPLSSSSSSASSPSNSTRRSSRLSTSPSFHIGDRVMSKIMIERRPFIGSITNVNKDGSFAVTYDDGEYEHSVPRMKLMHASFNAGDRVVARYYQGRRSYPGYITNVNVDGTYAVSYDDGDYELCRNLLEEYDWDNLLADGEVDDNAEK